MTASFEWGVHVLRPLTPEDVLFLEQAGLSQVSVPISWRWAERRRGVLDFASIEHFVRPLQGAQRPVQGLLGPGMPHLLPDWVLGEGGVDAEEYSSWFAAWCAAAVRALPWIRVWRVEDNLNAAFAWEGLRTRRRRGRAWRDPGFRLALLQQACAAVRSASETAELRLTVHAGIPRWRSRLKAWLDSDLRFDRLGLTLQPCMLLPDPAMADRIGEATEQALSLMQAAGRGDVPVEIGRTGYATARRSFSPRRQREFLVQAGQAARDAGAAGLHWWALRDQAHDDPILGYWTPEQERHMGLLFYDSTPKPVADELRVLATGDRFGVGGT